MAIVTCVECGKEVSSEAKTCPHCGKKLKADFLDKAKEQASQLSERAKVSEKLESAKSSIKSDFESGGIQNLTKNKYVIGSAVGIFVIILLLVILSGGGAPKCSDNDVKKLVLDIANEENINQLTTQFVGNRFTYNALKQSNDDDAKALIEQIDSQLANISMSLTDIRTSGQDDKIRKCQCGANLVFSNGKSSPIEYTAQYTEDGQIYVEVLD